MNSPVANRNPRQTNKLAVIFGALAILYAWMVIYPSRHTGFALAHRRWCSLKG